MGRVGAGRAGVRQQFNGRKTLAGSWSPNGGYGAPSLSFVGTWASGGSGTVFTDAAPSGSTGGVSLQLSGKSYVAGNNGTVPYTALGTFNPLGVIVMNAAGTVIFGTWEATNPQ